MKKQLVQTFHFPLLLLFILLGGQSKAQSESPQIKVKIDEYVRDLIKKHQIPGVALAIIKNGKVVHQKNYGAANLEHAVPISNESIFRVYSLTKLFVSTGIFQLIEENKLSLEDPISDFVSDLPSDWEGIQIKHLLSHSSGLPDMEPIPEFQNLSEAEAKKKIFQQDLQFLKGSKYSYNQTNFWLLQIIIEKVSGESFDDFILKTQFDFTPESKKVFFSSDSRNIILNRTTPYFFFETGKLTIDHPHVGSYFHAANGLNITLDEFIKWDEKLKSDKLISLDTRKKMFSNFPYKYTNKKFTYGWDHRVFEEHNSYGFSGSLVTAYRIFPEEDLSIIFLSNGLGNYYNIENTINYLASLFL